MWVEAPTTQTEGCTFRVTRHGVFYLGEEANPRVPTRCRSATIAVRRPRVTAPAAARVGRARALPVWRAAAPAARRAAGGSRRTPPAAWVSTLRNLKRWRAPTPDGGTTAARPRMATWRPRLSLSLSSVEQPRAREFRAVPPPRGHLPTRGMQHVGDPAAARTGARRGRPAPGPAAGQGRGDGLCARCRSVTFTSDQTPRKELFARETKGD